MGATKLQSWRLMHWHELHLLQCLVAKKVQEKMKTFFIKKNINNFYYYLFLLRCRSGFINNQSKLLLSYYYISHVSIPSIMSAIFMRWQHGPRWKFLKNSRITFNSFKIYGPKWKYAQNTWILAKYCIICCQVYMYRV